MSDIITNLEDLNPEDLKAVGNLINKLAKRNKQQNPEQTVDKQESSGYDNPEPTAQQSAGRSQPRNTKSGRSSPRASANKRPEPVRRGRGVSRGGQGRTESVSLANENKFERMRERNDFKKDSAIDRKLWGDRNPTERPEEFEFAEAQCKVCRNWFDINPNLVLLDPETKEYNFTCDNCVPRGN
ncbi:hypothetical protein DRO61_01855 [Candidatus Bathyarchaeota archaeon]|nr:MAG: hypothetical protein DRO61_01855 [Candidatus Bathyarchaeota archaeon]